MGRVAKSTLASSENILGLILVLYFLTPFLVLLGKGPWTVFFLPGDFFWALKNTIYQASLSAVLSTGIGFVVALGLSARDRKSWQRRFIEIILIAPNFLPSLLSLVLMLNWIKPFPFGVLGTALVHSFINIGIIGVTLAQGLENDLAAVSKLAFIEGATRFQLLYALRKPLFSRLRSSFFFVFAVCFGSFTVPLIVGGGSGTTLEVLIFEKVRIDGDLSAALPLALVQSMLLFCLSAFFLKLNFNAKTAAEHQRLRILPVPWVYYGLCLVMIILTMDAVAELWEGFRMARGFAKFWQEVLSVSAQTMIICGEMVIISSVLFAAHTFLEVTHWSQKITSGIVSLSPALVGFAGLLINGEGSIFILTMCLSVLFFPGLWRILGLENYGSLKGQVETAKILGGSSWQIHNEIIWPQLKRPWFIMMSIMILWTVGEFAVSRLVLGQELTLGIMAGNLLSSYRTQWSFLVTFWALCLGLGMIGLLYIGVYVGRPKSFQKIF